MDLLPTATSADERERGAQIAVLPVGSFEQHGDHLPLTTDTIVACTIAKAIADRYNLFLLPPITISCSHEHASFPGTISISATTLYAIISDIASSASVGGTRGLLIVNGHGGNYVLSNVVQELNVGSTSAALYPISGNWAQARQDASMQTDQHEDMHAGELEASVLLAVARSSLRDEFRSSDHIADERPLLLSAGMSHYTASGVIGRPSAATSTKGTLLIESLATQAEQIIEFISRRL